MKIEEFLLKAWKSIAALKEGDQQSSSVKPFTIVLVVADDILSTPSPFMCIQAVPATTHMKSNQTHALSALFMSTRRHENISGFPDNCQENFAWKSRLKRHGLLFSCCRSFPRVQKNHSVTGPITFAARKAKKNLVIFLFNSFQTPN